MPNWELIAGQPKRRLFAAIVEARPLEQAGRHRAARRNASRFSSAVGAPSLRLVRVVGRQVLVRPVIEIDAARAEGAAVLGAHARLLGELGVIAVGVAVVVSS